MIKISNDLALYPIKKQDQGQLYELMHKIYPPVYSHLWSDGGKSYLQQSYSDPAFSADLVEPDTLYDFVKFGDEIIGMIRLMLNAPHVHFESRKAAKLQRIYLGDTAQGKGIGKTLMQWMESHVRKAGASIFWLEVMDTQEKAIGFYEKLGFKKFNSVKFPSETMFEEFNGLYQMWKTV